MKRAPQWARHVAASLALAGLCAAAPASAGHFPMYASWAQPDGPGSPISLSYSFSNLLDGSLRLGASGEALPASLLRSAFETALRDYAAVLPIHFVEVFDAGPLPETGEYDPTGLADIRVGQVAHIDDANAYAYFPFAADSGLAGDIVFNAGRFGAGWTSLMFYAVAQHELGHSLGMGHYDSSEPSPASLLHQGPVYEGAVFPLEAETVAALQGVYGAGSGSVTPLSAVPEPAAAALLLAGLAVVAVARRRRGPDKEGRQGMGKAGARAWRVVPGIAARTPACGVRRLAGVPRVMGAPRPCIRSGLLVALLTAASPLAWALQIEFDYRYDTRGFFTDALTGAPLAERRAMLDLAASYYSGFTDSLTAIAPGEGDHWSVSFLHPSLGGPGVTLDDVDIAADTIRIYVGGSPSAPGVLGFAGTGFGLQAAGSAAFVDAVTTRGQPGTSGPQASDYATWGGYIWFNASNDWYFGADAAGLVPGSPDFLTTATHEIGHILGFGEADSWLAQIDADTGLFLGTHAVAAYGAGVPVDRYASHWAEGTYSVRDGLSQEAMMDPSTPTGERQLPTVLDYAGFADLGWQVSTVPEPGRQALLLAGLGLIGCRLRGRRA